MHGENSRLFQSVFKTDIEIGRIDTDEQVGTCVDKVADQPTPYGNQLRKMPGDFRKAHDGETVHGKEAYAPLLFHEWSANALYPDIIAAGPQRLDEPGTQLITGGFIGENPDSDQRFQRTMLRSLI
jgi:hypothetical protein